MNFCDIKKKLTLENIIYYLCVGVSFCLMCVALWHCFFESVISDEVFTLYIVDGSYLDIIINTVLDVHPPMFYFIIKFFVDIFTFLLPSINVVILSKVISFSGLAILFYFVVFKASKKLPKVVVGLALLILFCFGSFSEYAITIRMYSFAMLFVFLCFYYSIQIIRYKQLRDFRWFVLYFVLAALTHYFALMAVAGLLLFMILYSLVCERKYFLTFYKYAVYAVISYLPWLVVLCCQFAYLSSYGYWIPTISTNSVSAIFKYVFSIKLIDGFDGIGMSLILMGLYLLVLFANLFNKKIQTKQKWIAFSGPFVMFFVIGMGLLISVLLTPIFVERYTLPCIFVFYLCVIYNFYLLIRYCFKDLIVKLFKNKTEKANLVCKWLNFGVQCAVVCVLSIYAAFNMIKVNKHEKYINSNYEYMVAYFNSISDDIVLADHGAVQHPIEYQTEHFIYGLDGCDVSWWENITGVVHPKLSTDQIKTYISEGKDVYFVERFNDFSTLELDGLKYVLDASFVIEQQWYTVYEIDVYKIELA